MDNTDLLSQSRSVPRASYSRTNPHAGGEIPRTRNGRRCHFPIVPGTGLALCYLLAPFSLLTREGVTVSVVSLLIPEEVTFSLLVLEEVTFSFYSPPKR